MKNNRPRKGKRSNSRPTGFSANSNCTTNKLFRAIKAKKLSAAAEILEDHGVVWEVALIFIGHLDLIVRGAK